MQKNQTSRQSRPRRRKARRTSSLIALLLVLILSVDVTFALHENGMPNPHPTDSSPVPAQSQPVAADRQVPAGEAAPEISARKAADAFDLQGFIDQEVAAGKKKVIIPAGQHRVVPNRKVHLALSGLNDMEIVADGVEMICTETTRALAVSNCRNLTIRGLTIDYDPLPFTQGRIVAISADNRVHDIELFEGYPPADAVIDFKYEIFRPDTRTLRFGSYHDFSIEKTGPMQLRVTRSGRYQGEQAGDIIAIGTNHAPGGRIPHAVTVDDSVDVTLDGIKLYASNCFGFLEGGCTRTTYRRCVIDRRSPEDDLKPRSDPRIRSLNADAYHSKRALIGPQIIECVARFQADDCINICGDYHLVMASKGSTLRVLAKHRLNIEVGDPVELVTYEGMRLPEATVLEVEEMAAISEEERDWLSGQSMHRDFKTGNMLNRIYKVRIHRRVDLPRGSVIAAANRMGNGFKVVGCNFGFNRSRGILIKASRGEVTGNRLEGCEGEAIKVAPEWWWLESGNSSDVRIAGNTIQNCSDDGIAVYAQAGKGGIAPAGAHEDIEIIDNAIENVKGRHLYVTSTIGLTLRDNTCDSDRIELVHCEKVRRR